MEMVCNMYCTVPMCESVPSFLRVHISAVESLERSLASPLRLGRKCPFVFTFLQYPLSCITFFFYSHFDYYKFSKQITVVFYGNFKLFQFHLCILICFFPLREK
jgi:hypothetical protein